MSILADLIFGKAMQDKPVHICDLKRNSRSHTELVGAVRMAMDQGVEIRGDIPYDVLKDLRVQDQRKMFRR